MPVLVDQTLCTLHTFLTGSEKAELVVNKEMSMFGRVGLEFLRSGISSFGI
jgi:hypothetical protein